LARLPVLRKSDLVALQQATPPFGGLNATPLSDLARVLISPGPIFEPEGHAADYYRFARALFAAGFRRGDLVINTFAYHLTPGGWIGQSAAEALGCPVIPAGVGNPEAGRLFRHPGLPQEPAGEGGGDRQGRLLPGEIPGLRRGAAAEPAGRDRGSRGELPAGLCHRRSRPHRL
jgi:hypothetical protein